MDERRAAPRITRAGSKAPDLSSQKSGDTMLKSAGIVLEVWKVKIFKDILHAGGYVTETTHQLGTDGTALLTVFFIDADHLTECVKAACLATDAKNNEARKS